MNTGPKPYEWKEIFLNALRHIPVQRYACDAAKVNRTTVWRARETDPEFAKEMDDCIEDGLDAAEIELMRRAVHGWQEPVIEKGKLAYAYTFEKDKDGNLEPKVLVDEKGQPVPLTIRKHSDSLLQFTLTGRRRHIYGNKQEISGPNGGAIVMDSTARGARLAALMAEAQARKDNEGIG